MLTHTSLWKDLECAVWLNYLGLHLHYWTVLMQLDRKLYRIAIIGLWPDFVKGEEEFGMLPRLTRTRLKKGVAYVASLLDRSSEGAVLCMVSASPGM